MGRVGIWLLIYGLGSFLLPMFGLQFRLLSLFGSATPIVGVVLAVVGGAMVFLGSKSQPKA